MTQTFTQECPGPVLTEPAELLGEKRLVLCRRGPGCESLSGTRAHSPSMPEVQAQGPLLGLTVPVTAVGHLHLLQLLLQL